MAQSTTLTGKAGNLTLNGVVLPITKWTCKFNKELGDTTDSSTFNTTTGQLWKSQASGDLSLEGSIEGHFDLATTNADVLALIYGGDGPYPLTLGLNASTNLISTSNVDLSDAEVTVQVPGTTVIDWTASWKSNGLPSFG